MSERREAMIRTVAQAMHDCTSHADYPDYDEAPCCGTPQPALINPTEFHKDVDHEKGARGICWSCEPLAAAAVDALLVSHSLEVECDATVSWGRCGVMAEIDAALNEVTP